MVKNFSKSFGIAAVGLFLAASLSACADIDDSGTVSTQNGSTQASQSQGMTQMAQAMTQAASQASTQEDTIKVGAIFPLSGDGAAFGLPMQKVADIALNEINAKAGVNGKQLEFLWEDGKCETDAAADAATKLIQTDHVQIIYGGFCSSETKGIAKVAEAAHVVVLSPASSSPEITTAGDYIFRNYPSDATQGKVLALGAQKAGFKKVGIIAEENDYTTGIQNVFTDEFQKLGGTVTVETYLPKDTEFGTALSKLQTAKVDALFVDPQTPAKADLIFKQLQAMKWDVKLMGNDVVAGYQDLISKYSKLVEGMITAEFTYDKTNPGYLKLVEEYKKETGKDLPYGTYATTGYDAVYIIDEALEKVGNNADAVKAYLYAIKDRKGLGGTLNFDENGDPKAGHSLEIVQDGKVVLHK